MCFNLSFNLDLLFVAVTGTIGVNSSFEIGCLGAQVTDNGLAVIGKMTSLTDLNLACCQSIRDAGLAALLWLRGLQALTLRACTNITDTGVELLGNLSSLTHLDLWGCINISKVGLVPFAKKRASKDGLRHLNLDGCFNVDSDCLEQILPTMSLTYLNVSGCRIRDECFTCLAQLSNLQTLWAAKCGLTDICLAKIGGISSITSLHLGGNDGITDQGLAHLSQLSNLRTLDLHECRHGITEDGLVSLQPLKALMQLDISENDRVPTAVARLCSILPSVNRFWY